MSSMKGATMNMIAAFPRIWVSSSYADYGFAVNVSKSKITGKWAEGSYEAPDGIVALGVPIGTHGYRRDKIGLYSGDGATASRTETPPSENSGVVVTRLYQLQTSLSTPDSSGHRHRQCHSECIRFKDGPGCGGRISLGGDE